MSVEADERATLMEHWDQTFEYIIKAKEEGSKILVHCETGISNSAAVVIAYAMKAHDWDLSQALSHVKMKRDCIKPNRSLLQQLLTYQGILEDLKNGKNKLHPDVITIDDDSDDDIIELPVPQVSSSTLTPQQQQQQQQQQSLLVNTQSNASSASTNVAESPTDSSLSTKLSTATKHQSERRTDQPEISNAKNSTEPGANYSITQIQKNKEAQKKKLPYRYPRLCENCYEWINDRHSCYRHRKFHGCGEIVKRPVKNQKRSEKKHESPIKGSDRVYEHSNSFYRDKITHELKFSCEHCQRNFDKRAHLKYHELHCNGGQNFECDHCKRSFVKRPGIILHVKWCKLKDGAQTF